MRKGFPHRTPLCGCAEKPFRHEEVLCIRCMTKLTR